MEYLFVDAVFESLRRHGVKEALLVAWCIASDGRKHLLQLAVGNKKSQAYWTEFFRHMLDRGMRLPTTVTSDGAPGLIRPSWCASRPASGSGAGFTGWATSAPSCPTRPPARSWPTSTPCATWATLDAA